MPRSRSISSRPPWKASADHDATLVGEGHNRNDAPHGRIKRTSRGTAMADDVRGRLFVAIPTVPGGWEPCPTPTRHPSSKTKDRKDENTKRCETAPPSNSNGSKEMQRRLLGSSRA
mmetsp:Transcript_5776/g.35888  ORF Transcript_5776/g.35888 Transcript_5776/m.35888 type:complete len:116 (-) Transcript_5776:3499-3846(-)